MTTEEREELIDWLTILSGWSRQAFEKMADEELIQAEEKYRNQETG